GQVSRSKTEDFLLTPLLLLHGARLSLFPKGKTERVSLPPQRLARCCRSFLQGCRCSRRLQSLGRRETGFPSSCSSGAAFPALSFAARRLRARPFKRRRRPTPGGRRGERLPLVAGERRNRYPAADGGSFLPNPPFLFGKGSSPSAKRRSPDGFPGEAAVENEKAEKPEEGKRGWRGEGEGEREREREEEEGWHVTCLSDLSLNSSAGAL
ncbi:hypothetical protein E2320_011101, partial [Naja naja]